jgi:hypothetical protein
MHMSFAGTFYGVAFTKTNPDFVATFEKQFQKDSKILIVCQEGLRSEDHIPDIRFTVSLCKHLGMSEFFQCFSFPPSSLDLQEKSFNPWFLASYGDFLDSHESYLFRCRSLNFVACLC